ncbi:hypothetical protein GL174_18110 [Sphingobium sp. CAP-1]|nr:hypothetical protein GL174_18110 [Sphingobium sp. CAP-1]
MMATINYGDRAGGRMAYRANDSSRDTVCLAPEIMPITDMRGVETHLDSEGFQMIFCDPAGLEDEAGAIGALLRAQCGADLVVPTGQPVRRFAERSDLSGRLDNSRPARFAHVDISDGTARTFSARSLPPGSPAPVRSAHYNLWRVTSPAPQDVPLALCDARTVAAASLLPADAIFDRDGVDIWSFEGLVCAHDPGHRWCWFSDMGPGEAILFKTWDSDPARAHCVPHVAFDNPLAPADTPPRASVEMRAIAYWF